MKNILILIFIICQINVFGQVDPLINKALLREYLQCDHSHICCYVGCYCCPESAQLRIIGNDSLKVDSITNNLIEDVNFQISINGDPRVAYPNDGLTYNQYVGETYAGFDLANGWRQDTINGGYNKEIYNNPYVTSTRFEKQGGKNLVAYRYHKGKLFSGFIEDTLTVSFTPNKIKGHLNGRPYYESKNITLIFRGNIENGVLQGKGVLCGLVPQYGIYNNITLSECYFEHGEIIGICTHWDLNSIDFEIHAGNIRLLDEKYDYFEFKKLLELTEVTYTKGNSEYTKYTIFKRIKKQEK